jgi:hypothetical protein
MKTLNPRLVLSALGIVAMLSSPAFAQKSHHQTSPQVQAPMTEQYPVGNLKSGSESSQFDQDNGYYQPGSGY